MLVRLATTDCDTMVDINAVMLCSFRPCDPHSQSILDGKHKQFKPRNAIVLLLLHTSKSFLLYVAHYINNHAMLSGTM